MWKTKGTPKKQTKQKEEQFWGSTRAQNNHCFLVPVLGFWTWLEQQAGWRVLENMSAAALTSCSSGPKSSAQSETGLKVCQPETSLRPSPSARLLACLTCAQPATCHPASGPSVHETGLAHPATRPSSRRAQPATHLSPACPAQAPAHLRACHRPPAPSWHQQAQPSVPRSGLANDQSHVSETGLKLRQPLSLSDVPQPPSPAAQAAQPRLTVLVLDFKPSEQDGFRTSN